jgi:hypothetical protein
MTTVPTPGAAPDLAPVPDPEPAAGLGLDSPHLRHRHGTACHWDLEACGWHCAPEPVALPTPPPATLPPGCTDVA